MQRQHCSGCLAERVASFTRKQLAANSLAQAKRSCSCRRSLRLFVNRSRVWCGRKNEMLFRDFLRKNTSTFRDFLLTHTPTIKTFRPNVHESPPPLLRVLPKDKSPRAGSKCGGNESNNNVVGQNVEIMKAYPPWCVRANWAHLTSYWPLLPQRE